MTWLRFLNFLLICVIITCVGLCLIVFCKKEPLIQIPPPRAISDKLPLNPFALASTAYEAIGEGPLSLHWQAPKMQLPDLRQEIIFTSKNCRPDNPKGKALVHLSLRSSHETLAVYEKQRIYLIYRGYDKSSLTDKLSTEILIDPSNNRTGEYFFSPDNQPTPLWCEFKTPQNQPDTIEMRVSLIDEKGSLATTPQEYASFSLHVQDGQKVQFFNCEIGGYRADPTLLVRQKARWLGKDAFFEMHGGEEHAWTINKERIDFLNEHNPYSCFIQAGDFLIWDGSQWRHPARGERSLDFPLLVINKIEEKVMSLELWDLEGKGKVMLNLIRGHDMQGFPSLEHEFKFVGAKTWAQFIVECQGKRMMVKLNEWLLLTPEGWIKLETPQAIDDYVDQKLVGSLFIIDNLEKENGRQYLAGHLFNISRTEVQNVRISSSALPGQINPFPLPAPLSANQINLHAEEE